MRSGDVVGGRFRVESLAGSGGMGSVWRALDKETGHKVALKLLHGRDPRDTARFIREAQVIAGLAHPGIVAYVADGQISETERYLVMEWLEGESLADRLTRERLTLGESLLMGQRASEALSALHGHGIVHRDLKPSNLFLEAADPARVKIIDFGIARRASGPDVTRAGVLLGTPGYIAPEQALGDPNVDARADVFALGCVLFRCITGEGAFGTEDDLTILLRIVKGTAQRAREVVRLIPAEVDDFLAWLLAREPADRPRDASVVALALARLVTIYGPGRPGDDPLDELITTRSQAVISFVESDKLGATSPFPLMVPKRESASAADVLDEDEAPLSAADLEEIRSDTGLHEASKAFAAHVARALTAAEAAAPKPPPSVALPATSAHPTPPALGVTPPSQVSIPKPPSPPRKWTPLPSSSPRVAAPPLPPRAAPPPPVSPVPRSAVAAAPSPRVAPPGPASADGGEITAAQCLTRVEAFLKQNDFRSALMFARRGIDAGAQGEVYGALRVRQAEAHRWRGEREGAEHAANDAMSVLSPGSELWWLAAREAVLGAGARGDVARIGALAEEMMRLLPGKVADAASAAALVTTSAFVMHTGQKERADRLFRFAEPLLLGAMHEGPAVAARLFQFRMLRAVHEGDVGAYLEAAKAAAERFAAAQDMRNSLIQRVNIGFAKIELGAYAAAEADLRAVMSQAERMGLNNVTLATRANLGVVLGKRGQFESARALMIDVLKESVAERDRRLEASVRTHLALLLLASGDEAGALREARGAVDLTASDAPPHAFALAALARAQLAHQKPVAALEAAERAMELLETFGGIEEGESLLRLTFAEARRATGDLEGAASAIAAARARLTTRAAGIADPALRQSFLRDIAENAQTLTLAREAAGEH